MSEHSSPDQPSLFKRVHKLCLLLFLALLLACLILAFIGSKGLSAVTVTALPDTKEPKDNPLTLLKNSGALPDYKLQLTTSGDSTISLGTRPDQSAREGIRWVASEPVNLRKIVGIRLSEQDKLVSDAITEIPFSATPVDSKGYRFEMETVRTFQLGIYFFFTTPIGYAILVAIFIAVLFLLMGTLSI